MSKVPVEGLKAVLRAWNGRGIVRALTDLPEALNIGHSWTTTEVRRRSSRVLLEKLCADQGPVSKLPSDVGAWFDVMPASTRANAWRDSAPRSGVSWPDTFRKSGWPPTAFFGRRRWRVHDEQIVAPAAWIASQILSRRDEAATVFPEVGASYIPAFGALRALLDDPQFAAFEDSVPSHESIRALAAEGGPWASLASIGVTLLRLGRDPESLLDELLWPDDAIAWRLFHLGCVGMVLVGLRQAGAQIKSNAPIDAWCSGPAFTAVLEKDAIEVWYEASRMWSAAGIKSPYARVSSRSSGSSGRTLGADIVVRKGSALLILECKYYSDEKKADALHDGYVQASTYGAEAYRRLANRVWSAAVLPQGQIERSAWARMPFGPVGVVSASDVGALTCRFLRRPGLKK